MSRKYFQSEWFIIENFFFLLIEINLYCLSSGFFCSQFEAFDYKPAFPKFGLNSYFRYLKASFLGIYAVKP